jgi:zinc-ribbon family
MFFFFGTRTKSKGLGQVERPCPKCGRATMHTAIEVKRRFTLFFIPLIPLGTRYVNKCGACGLATKGAPLQPQDNFKLMAAKP